MAKVAITEQYLEDIADAIREKTGLSTLYKPADMASAISTISGGGGDNGFSTATVTFEVYGGFTLLEFPQIETRTQPRKLNFILTHDYESTYDTFSRDALLVDGVGKFYVDSEYATITVSGNATYDDGEVIYTGDCTISVTE